MVLTFAALAFATFGRMPSIPNQVGFAGPFAGVSHGTLLVAGGANFPDKLPWEGGTKAWYERIFALTSPSGTWQRVGKLPRPLGYGVSISFRSRVVCAGGSDVDQHYADVFALQWVNGHIETTSLPSLPIPIANGCGALVGDTLYVAGGQLAPDSTSALNRVFTLDLSEPSAVWKELPPLPGPGRILATAAGWKGAFYIFGGASLRPDAAGKPVRTYLSDAYRYDARGGWKRLAELPHPVVAAPSPCPVSRQGISILGGDDGSKVGSDPRYHPGFSRDMLRYDPAENTWRKVLTLPFSLVTTCAVPWEDSWIVTGGERRPGIRSNSVWQLKLAY